MISDIDAVQWLKALPDGIADCMLVDPAYASLEKHRSIGTTTRLKNSKASSNAWFDVVPNSYFPEFFAESYRVLRRGSHAYVMCDDETSDVIKPMAIAAGFKYWKRLIWDKLAIGMGYHYRSRREFVLFFEKGKRKLNDLSIPDVLDYKRVWGGYPTEKPVDLCRLLIEQSTQPGEIVIDPFCGSGSSGVGAVLCGRTFLGNDKCTEAARVASQRIAAARPDGLSEIEAFRARRGISAAFDLDRECSACGHVECVPDAGGES